MGVAGDATTADKPKKHSPFIQTLLRKGGESLDLLGKAVLGFGGFKSLFAAHRLSDLDWPRLLIIGAVGGVALSIGIYLQAKAEET